MEIKLSFRILYILVLALLSLSACKKTDTVDMDNYNKPAVEAYLVPGKAVEVKVYEQKALQDTSAYGQPISGLQLTVSDGTQNYTLTETTAGVYTIDDAQFVKEGTTYTLAFIYLGKEISAQTTVPGKPQGFTLSADTFEIPSFGWSTVDTFKTIQVTWNNPDAAYHVLVFRNQDAYPTPVGFGSIENGNYHVEINAEQTSSYEIQPMTFRYLGHYKAILYRVNKEYIDMLDNNGTSSQNLTNPPTNVKNGLGIFTAMQADTLDLNVVKAE
ncbi:DUF4249 family protein [Pedobacter sp. BS3]|uniref:DUF4249 family protein n=1 Tax=Pedobacter sp. BS3 TaxID=2567937 RepID=UPI0011F00D00|nr:DUF4249 family protein [Pedobacter sp. BS3]TZF81325.1 DUF4249 family protein [Pedobacter sp. BS3]